MRRKDVKGGGRAGMKIGRGKKSYSVIEENIIEKGCKQEGNGEAGQSRKSRSRKTEKEDKIKGD